MGQGSRWTQRWVGWRRWGLAAFLAATTTFAIDRVRIAVVGASATAMSVAQEWTLWGGHATLASIVLLVGSVAWLCGRALPTARRDGWLGRIVAPSCVALAVGAWPLRWVGRELASGAWISEQWFAPLVAVFPLVLAVVALPLAFALAFSVAPASRRQQWMTGALALGVLVLGVADHRVAPGIYAPFHMMLHVAMAGVSIIAAARWLRSEPRWSSRAWVFATATALVCVAGPASWAAMSSTTRSALVLRSAMARDWIRNAMPQRAKRLLHDMLASLDVGAGTYAPSEQAPAAVTFEGRGRRNIVLVVVDTLRADALPPARPEAGMPFAQPGDTPRLDAWMEGAYRFRYAYSTSTKTHRAMPTMFRSIRAGDDPLNSGVTLGLRMEALGLRPGAVVNTFFIAEKFPQIAALMDGFGEDVSVYEKLDSSQAVPRTLELIRSFGDQQFFVWLHLYNMHDPGFDGAMLGAKDGGRVERYQRSLRYLDAQFGALLDGLGEIGVDDDTIVVLTSDHGEGLGDHGQMLHGPNVFEEDIGVPFAFAIPGASGRVLEETVGTIDLAPTLVDLLGAPPNASDRGRSLVPLFVSEPQEPQRPYFFEAADNDTVGVVVARDKLIYESDIDVVHRFDIGEDPDEKLDVYTAEGELDAALLRTLVAYRPSIVAEELEQDGVLALLRERLGEVDPAEPGAALPLLIQLVALRPERDLVRRCAALFEGGTRDVRLLIARHLLARAPKTMTPRVVAWFESIADTPEELEVVTALSQQGQAAFAPTMIAGRIEHWARTGAPATWEPWLRLVSPWPKPMADFVGPLTAMLARSQTGGVEVPISVLELVLNNAADLDLGTKAKGKAKPATPTAAHAEARVELVSVARRLLDHADPRIRTSAMRVLGQFDDKDAVPLARARMLDRKEDLRVRRESATTFTRLAGEGAIADLIELAEDNDMTTFAVRNLRTIGTAGVVPFLRKIQKEHYNGYLRREAGKAADAIEKKLAKKPAKPPAKQPGRKKAPRAGAEGDAAP